MVQVKLKSFFLIFAVLSFFVNLYGVPHNGNLDMAPTGELCFANSQYSWVFWSTSLVDSNGHNWVADSATSEITGGNYEETSAIDALNGEYEINFLDNDVEYTIKVTVTYKYKDLTETVEDTWTLTFKTLTVDVAGKEDLALNCISEYRAIVHCGTPPYTYKWTGSGGLDGPDQSTIDSLAKFLGPQWLKLKVTDNNGVEKTFTKNIEVHEEIELMSASTNQVFDNEILVDSYHNFTSAKFTEVVEKEISITRKIGISVDAGLDLSKITVKLNGVAEYTIVENAKITTTISLEGSQSVDLYAQPFYNITTGVANQWGCDGFIVTGNYYRRHDHGVRKVLR